METLNESPNSQNRINFYNIELYKWEGFWYPPCHLKAIMEAQTRFKTLDNDIILASPTKSGTTWFKSLIPWVVGHNDDQNRSPNLLIRSLESQFCVENSRYDTLGTPSPRVFQTHVPYSALPESIKRSECKIVYITRNTEDTFLSMWRFVSSLETSDLEGKITLGQFFNKFCEGVYPYGPFHDHVLEYWNESLKRPTKILFMRYDEMRRDPKGELKKLASFLGRPFKREKEVEKMWWRCSLERLKTLKANKNEFDPWVGTIQKNDSYFRLLLIRGFERSLITMEMKKRLDKITCDKLKVSDLQLGCQPVFIVDSIKSENSIGKNSVIFHLSFARKFLELRVMLVFLLCLLFILF